MKTILIIDNSVSVTGAFKCALNEAVLLRDEYRFVFAVPTSASVLPLIKEAGFTVYELPMLEIGKSVKKLVGYLPRLYSNARRVKKIIAAEKVAVIQVNDFYNLLGTAARMQGFKGKLLTYVRFLPNSVPGPLRHMWLRVAYRYADKVIAVSNAVLKQLPEQAKNQLLYDAIAFPETLARTPYTDGTVRFLFLSNFIQGKGQDYAVQAMKQLVTLQQNVSLTFIGGDMGLEKNRQYRKGLEEYVTANDLAGYVSFQSFSSNVEAAYKQADVALNFSDSESFSMTCAEAAFYGTPVIATRCGGPEEIVGHGVTGLLVGKGAIEEMAQAMHRLATDAGLRQLMGLAASHCVREKFAAGVFCASFSKLIETT